MQAPSWLLLWWSVDTIASALRGPTGTWTQPQPNIQLSLRRRRPGPQTPESSTLKRRQLNDLRVSANASIRYREPEICETTEGVRSFSGYVDLELDGGRGTAHTFFWFFEARREPEKAPITLWLNGGPGSDSLVGLFTEIGPCSVTPDLNTTINPFSWSEVSNLLFLSQPLGVGFSYEEEKDTGNQDSGGSCRTQQIVNGSDIDTTGLAAEAAWHVVQTFLAKLPEMSGRVTSRNFSLWTESYGGHYGPTFLRHFHQQNELVMTGEITGVPLTLTTLGIGNGIIDAAVQFPHYPEFAMNNTHGIKAVADEVYNYMKFASDMFNGCLDQVYRCKQAVRQNRKSIYTRAVCTEASNMCRDNVEGPYYMYSGRSMYDIRQSESDPAFPDFFIKYLNLPQVQEALGVDLVVEERGKQQGGGSGEREPYRHYEETDLDVYASFQQSGDYVYPDYLEDLRYLLDHGVRVVLMYGDADYIGNWYGGEAVSLALNHAQAALFRATPYRLFLLDDETIHGRAREQGNLTFLAVHDAGHFVPAVRPDVALEVFRRATAGMDIPRGQAPVGGDTWSPPPLFPPDEPFVATSSSAPLPSSSAVSGIPTGMTTSAGG